MRWWIIEDALRDSKGHWLEYLQTFQRGLMAEGDEVRFFVSEECSPEIASLFEAEAVLPLSIWARMSDGAPKWRRLLRIPAHGLAIYRAISRLVTRHSVGRLGDLSAQAPVHGTSNLPDLIFVPTVLVHHLVGWIPLIKRKLSNLPCRVLLFFPNAPVDLNEDGVAHLLPDPTAKLFQICIRSLAKEVAAGKVILGGETRPMVKALSEVTGVPFTYLPHPVELSATQSPATGSSPSPATPEKPILFGCYGAARYEKGSDVLQAAMRLVLEGGAEIPVKFALQWLDEFTDAQGKLVKLDPWLKAHPAVDVIERYFGEGGYAVQLAATDVMVLPYRSPYRLRVSRVLVEAMLLGIPVIATRGTTLAEQAGEFGAMIPCTDGSAESLAAAINEAVESLPSLLATSQARRRAATRHFSVQHFRELLLG